MRPRAPRARSRAPPFAGASLCDVVTPCTPAPVSAVSPLTTFLVHQPPPRAPDCTTWVSPTRFFRSPSVFLVGAARKVGPGSSPRRAGSSAVSSVRLSRYGSRRSVDVGRRNHCDVAARVSYSSLVQSVDRHDRKHLSIAQTAGRGDWNRETCRSRCPTHIFQAIELLRGLAELAAAIADARAGGPVRILCQARPRFSIYTSPFEHLQACSTSRSGVF